VRCRRTCRVPLQRRRQFSKYFGVADKPHLKQALASPSPSPPAPAPYFHRTKFFTRCRNQPYMQGLNARIISAYFTHRNPS
jgi:hypothetical protein